jgi:hypothetical protein
MIVVSVCVATAAGGQEAGIHPRVPVIIEHSPEGYDPCAYGVVHNLDPKGDGFLAVKAGPGLHYERIDKLYNGESVIICGGKGVWYAIIYTKARQGQHMRYCDVDENPVKTFPYTGPCRSGWAHQRWINQISN